jgi:hypothetical protein
MELTLPVDVPKYVNVHGFFTVPSAVLGADAHEALPAVITDKLQRQQKVRIFVKLFLLIISSLH